MLGPVQTLRGGLARVGRARRLLLWLWLGNLLFALPLAVIVGAEIADSVRTSRVSQLLLDGLDLVWQSEFDAATGGVAGTLSPSHVGVGAFLDNLELWFTGRLFDAEPGLVAAGLLYGLFWALLLGGVLAYLQSGRQVTLRGFFALGGEFFARFTRLALVTGGLYYLVYRFSKWLFGSLEDWTRNVTVERTVLLYYLLAATVVLLLLLAVRMISDYAKIAIVMEDRRSALLAAFRAMRFLVRKPLRALTLVLAIGGAGLIALYAYHWLAPGTRQASWTAVLFAFGVGQLLLITRLGLRLTLLGAQLELYERTASFGGTVKDH